VTLSWQAPLSTVFCIAPSIINIKGESYRLRDKRKVGLFPSLQLKPEKQQNPENHLTLFMPNSSSQVGDLGALLLVSCRDFQSQQMTQSIDSAPLA
jgi:hypothetical protein